MNDKLAKLNKKIKNEINKRDKDFDKISFLFETAKKITESKIY